MNKNTLKILAAVVLALALLMFIQQRKNTDGAIVSGGLILPDLAAAANDVTNVQVTRSGENAIVHLSRNGENWTVQERDNYAADVAKVRQLIIALADAEIVEEKTSNPENYHRLNVADPREGGDGTEIVLGGDDFSFAAIIGDSGQGNARFARVVGDATSYLIDQNPELPVEIGDWLQNDILDVAASRVQRVSIAHADGESIVLEKSEAEQTDFAVLAIPEGRELSYATVANATGGALAALTLEDARAVRDGPQETTVVFDLWNGLSIEVAISSEDDGAWLAFVASARETTDSESDTDIVAESDNGDSSAGEASESSEAPAVSAIDEAAEINARLGRWQYQLADYKRNLLNRRWEDILKAESDE